jgi:trans-aconitate methyltransferase
VPNTCLLSQTEQERLKDQAEAWEAVMHGKLFHAPLNEPKLIIDIGCGPGVVSHELASKFPAAQIYGIDLSVLPEHSDRPSNLEYIYGDIRKLTTNGGDTRLAPGTIDYAFERLLLLGMTDWPGYIQTVADRVRSGGWAEIHEWDWQVSENGVNVSDEWPWMQEMIRSAWETKGLDLRCSQKLAGWMRDAGLVDIQTFSYRAPLSMLDVEAYPETRKMAEYLAKWWPRVNWLCIPALMGAASPEQVEDAKKQMLKDLEVARTEQHKSYEIIVCIGRKP